MAVDALVERALAANPEIAAARQRLAAARERPAQARSLPDPMISAGYRSSGNPLPGAGLGSVPNADVSVMVTQAFPYPGKRDLRAAEASHEADADAQQLEAVRLRVASRVKQAYYRLAYAYGALDVLARDKTLLDTLLEVSETRYSVGRAAQQDVIKAQTDLSLLELRRRQVLQERASREGELNALLDQPLSTAIGRPEDLTLPEFSVSLDRITALVAEHAPALRRDGDLIAGAETAVAAARRDYRPDFAVSGGYANMGAMPPMYEFRFDVSVPLRRARRAAAVAEQADRADEARATREATRQALVAAANDDYQTATTAAELARLYRETVLPQARLALDASLSSYETGTVDFLSVLTSFDTVFEYELGYLDQLASFHTAVSRLEEATATSLVP
ncbi:MAG: TolC family protein [Betaproteobacteria bacterium]